MNYYLVKNHFTEFIDDLHGADFFHFLNSNKKETFLIRTIFTHLSEHASSFQLFKYICYFAECAVPKIKYIHYYMIGAQ